MDPKRWERIQALFHEAAGLPASERRAFLAPRCEDDPDLIAEVLSLLEEDDRGESLLDQPLERVARHVLDDPSSFAAPPRIGPYRLTRLLGEGGMGVVYLAERPDLGSRVAIKLLRDAWLTPARRERFAVEQRTLAQLNHPSIARIYDGDTLPDGTPWFAMEYVEGVPVNEYAASRDLPVPKRLELFRAVCEAVLHAHQSAVIHRDLKPSNILVTEEGAVKLLDFGIAKHLDELDRADAQRTRTGLRMLTPAYAAPEQVRGEPVGVPADVYSLGVILYELLTGRPPYDLANRTPTEMARIVTEEVPERPSQVMKKLAASGGLSPARAKAASWADLDVLCMTAMQKDPARRYRTVDSLLQDIDHYLHGRPLTARPDTLGYRVGKFLRRNWRPVSAAAAVVMVLAGLTGFYTFRLASARNAAVAEANRTRRIQEFMNHLFEGGDPAAGPADSMRVITLLARGVQEARTLASEPMTQEGLYQTLGSIYRTLGDLEQADTLLTAAWSQRRSRLGESHPEVARSLIELGLLRSDQSRFDEAESMIRQALAIEQRARVPTPGAAHATTALGLVLENQGKYPEAIQVLTEAARLDSLAGVPDADRASALTELANCHFYSGNYAVSDSLNRIVLAMDRKTYGDRHPNVAADRINLGAIQQEWGRYEEAERYYREALDIYRGWYGDRHFETAASLTMVGRTLIFQKRLVEADSMLRQALTIRESVYGPEHQSVASTVNELGRVAQQEGRLDEAEAYFRRMAAIYRKVYDDKHYLMGVALSNLAGVYVERARYAEAEAMFRDAIQLYGETLPPDHLYAGIAKIRLGRAILRQHRFAEAESTTLAGYRVVAAQASPSVTWLTAAREDLVLAYTALNRPSEAARFRQELERSAAQPAAPAGSGAGTRTGR